MKNEFEVKKRNYNRKRGIKFCVWAASTFFACLFYLIFDAIIVYFYGNKELATVVGIIVWIYIGFACVMCYRIYSFNHPLYGKFTFADEFRDSKKFKCNCLKISKVLENELISKNYKKYMVNTDFVKGKYYYKAEKKKYYIVLFVEQKITKKIYNDYVNNSFCTFLDYLVDNKLLEDWKKIYITIIFKDDSDNSYSKKMIDYNLPLPKDIGFLPLMFNYEKNTVNISDFDFGLGLTEYDELKKEFLELLKKQDS